MAQAHLGTMGDGRLPIEAVNKLYEAKAKKTKNELD